MPSLSIKDVPETLAEALRQRAARNHRSLQGELMAILEKAGAAQDMPRYLAEPVSATYPAAPISPVPVEAPGDDGLLAELDEIVAGSQWGHAPLLSREQVNDRALCRELNYLALEDETRPAGQ
ncbi:MAG: Arc family DNA-binding protein [Sterolibacterium sp.]